MKKILVGAVAAVAMAGIAAPAFAAESATGKLGSDGPLSNLGGILTGVSWQFCGGNQALGPFPGAANVPMASPSDGSGSCTNASSGGSGLVGNVWPVQVCSGNGAAGAAAANAPLASPSSHDGDCTNASSGANG